ncbi:MAG: hypothetical protein EBT14_09240 [Betaproteobacteria bacterium]|nr:hypothetical protein [Betaproteobacteria bacterium]
MAVSLDAEIASVLNFVSIAPALWLEREHANLVFSQHLAHIDEKAAGMVPNAEALVTHPQLLYALAPAGAKLLTLVSPNDSLRAKV